MKNFIKDYILLLLGCIILSFTTSLLLIPNTIGTGGVTGIALCINKLFGFKIGMLSIILNIPLFLFGYKLLGNKFTFRSIVAVIISSLLIDNANLFFNIKPMHDTLLAAIFSGVFFGAGMALIFMAKGSTGGLDISAKIIINKFNTIPMSSILLFQDILVYILVGIVLGPSSVMYAVIMSYVRSKTMDAIQEGLSSSRQCVIICNNSDIMIDSIKSQLIRGVTVLDAVGGYTNKNKKFIYVVIQKHQLHILRSIVNNVEPTAFVTISPVNNIIGNYRSHALSI